MVRPGCVGRSNGVKGVTLLSVDRKSVRRAVRVERERLAAALRGLASEEWETPSLCEEWRVRDVVGHLLYLDAVYRGALLSFLVGTVRTGFRPHRFIAEDARRRAEGLSPEELCTAVERAAFEAGVAVRVHPWPLVPLSEIVVHGQDIRRPLGIAHGIPDGYLRDVAGFLWRVGHLATPRKKIQGIRLEATDEGWSMGEGPVVRGPAEALVMVLAGRRAVLEDLDGEGLSHFAELL